ncbi:hypothetical protein VD0002_g9410 [Verticillium dahliae]|uniref:Uncharacterized protein n=1 Tax=Verticillium dahliae TaxID=27337 RepID=A0AA44WEG9_VERDA|nr:hypothetical protein BJF96_g6746 [Verticillium dahliae]PNH37203.1 hypothetical protein VD0004_g9583 [Verticillium dahliae]PNH50969.1 hypothetical protein VD0003_g6255 [Verticillium dahliae]PNH58110.1 hypothetical protein VD0002_g9410 [Verticillium dahliae]PNH61967.1 hypothetical protein VD0001_g9584 [Verticillium dahliae]
MSYFVICSPLAPGPSIQLVYPLQIGLTSTHRLRLARLLSTARISVA